jgi:G:T/U-mismatch repair DNA glycosylase
MESHPFPTLIDQDTRTLIIGTFPPPRFTLPQEGKELLPGDLPYYYGSRNNQFWRLLAEVFPDELIWVDLRETDRQKAVEGLKDFLSNRRLGITDIVKTAERKSDTASDGDLIPISTRDVFYRLGEYPGLMYLLPTSRQAWRWMTALLRSLNWKSEPLPGYPVEACLFSNAALGSHELRCLVLPSPSPRAQGRGMDFRRKAELYADIFRRLAG